MPFARFMASSFGRLLRAVLGLALMVWGYRSGNTVLMVVGALPLLAGVFNVCLIAPLIGAPFSGRQVR